MPLILLALLLLFFLPWLGLLVLALLFFLLLLVPLGFAARSLAWLVVGPRELYRVLSDSRVRKNHALEHGTVNILRERYGITGLSGMAMKDGFSLSGFPDPRIILEAAETARKRLAAGETHLAIHKRCGTTLVMVNLLAAVIFILLLVLAGRFSLGTVLLSLAAAWVLGPLTSPLVQRYVTTDTRVEDLNIIGIETRPRLVRFPGGTTLLPSEVFVHTRAAGEPLVAEVIGP
ncbi:MAG TPA: hypothetical protein DDW96_01780 [Synergistaceae bacterium]|jgi:hypothetical protein|nr:MAG: Uncharacterized protein XD83_0324 [Synergistales bacterium 57_84]KUK88480.1 MAG: Uncharacterized protein XE01_0532 [Synergistales bacterium 58_81]HBG14045.1 hypothetical protein [Synergistaceae bacterium]HCP07731.1 hypothetical protein [Synergistaceae bacterium]